MKPIKLIMNAFGPYAKKTEIDFEELGESGLYLITGVTGAGKTTIFDAVSYALYGEASGSYRGTDSLRSDYADDDEESYVELTFSHREKIYRILRKPAQKVRKKRGTGFTEKNESVTLYYPDRAPAEGPRTVNREVIDLLRIDFSQFKQISMIAQGEFYQLLNAGTEERTKILQKIFMTEKYRKIGEVLKNRDSAAGNLAKEKERSLEQYFAGISADEDSIYTDELTELQKDPARAYKTKEILTLLARMDEENVKSTAALETEIGTENTVLDKIRQELTLAEENNRRFDDLDREKQIREQLEAKKPEILQKKEEAGYRRKALYTVAPVSDRLRDLIKQLKQRETRIESEKRQEEQIRKDTAVLEEKKRTEAEKLPQAQKHREAAALLEKDEPRYAEKDRVSEERKKLAAETEVLNAQITAMQEQTDKLTASAAEMKKQIEARRDADVRLARSEHTAGMLDHLFETADNLLQKNLPAYRRHQTAYLQAKEEAEKITILYDQAREQARHTEEVYDHSLAGIFAARLEEGKPCPVCGAIHHPSPAVLPGEHVTKEDVDRKREEAESIRLRKDQAVQKAAAALTSRNNEEKHLSEGIRTYLKELAENNIHFEYVHDTEENIRALENSTGVLTLRVQQNNIEMKACRKDAELVKKLEKDLADSEKTLTDLQQKLDAKKEQQNQLKNSYAAADALYANLPVLPYADLRTAVKARQELLKQAEEIEKSAEAAAEALRRSEQALTIMRTEIEKDEKEQQRIGEDLLQAQKDFGTVLAQNSFTDAEMFERYRGTEAVLLALEEQITDYERDVQVHEQLLGRLQKEAEGSSRRDIHELQETMRVQQEKVSGMEARRARLIHRREDRQQTAASIRRVQKEADKILKEKAVLEKLNKLINGNMTQRIRITLEQYVQASGFDGIIAAANQRLQMISGGQYELYRHEDPEEISGKNALNLDVLDNYTGKKRPVSSLSGGESFKASLSLALGLSDRISAEAGGITADALFIDEGFGTLDETSLNDAVDMLTKLSTNGKIIGIISHRPELEQRIRKQIVVEKSKDSRGSSLHIEKGY